MCPEADVKNELEFTGSQKTDIIYLCPEIVHVIGDDVSRIESIRTLYSNELILVEFICGDCRHNFLARVIEKTGDTCTWIVDYCKLTDGNRSIPVFRPVVQCVPDIVTIIRYINQGFQPISSISVEFRRYVLSDLIRSRKVRGGCAEALVNPENTIKYFMHPDGRICLKVSDPEGYVLNYIDFLQLDGQFVIRIAYMRDNWALTADEVVDSKGGQNRKFYEFLGNLFSDIRTKSSSN